MRKTFRLSLVIAATVLLAGCGGDNGDYSKYVTLGDYKNLSAKLAVEKVTDEELKNYEQEQLNSYVSYEDAEGPVEEGQLVAISLLAKEGDEIVYDFTEEGYELVVGQKDFGVQVDEALTGRMIGDVLDLTVSYDDDFEDVSLCGKEIGYHIEIQSISDVIYPELTNEFVKETFGEASVDAWRDTLKEELRSEHQAEAEEYLRSDLAQQAVAGSQITGYPKELYKQKRESVQADYQSYADMFGCSLEDVYEMLGVDDEKLKQEYLDETNRTMVLAMIRQQENLALSDEQMQEKLKEYAKENDYDSVENLLSDYEEEDLRQYFLNEMTLDFLEDHANIEVSEE